MQLLQINITPLKCELQVENAKLEISQAGNPSAKVQTIPGELKMSATPTILQLDSYDARRSVGFSKTGDLIKNAAQKTQDSLSKYISNTVETGKQMANIENGVTIDQIYSQKMLEQPSTVTMFIPSGGVNISWQPGQINVNFEPGSVNNDWQIEKSNLQYTAGSVKLSIIQRGGVEITYMGDPMYVPPSANPNFEES